MVATKNRAGRFPLGWVVLASALALAGCQPSGPQAVRKGEQLLRKGRYADAVKQLERAVRLMPQQPQAWNYLGLAYHANRQLPQAEAAYRKALALEPRFAPAHFNLGCLHLEQNRLPEALSALSFFTSLEGSSLDGWLKLGTAQLRAQQPDAAERSFRMALTLQPQNLEALNGLGLTRFQRRKPQEALEFFNAALARRPDYAPALLNAAVVLHQNPNTRPAALQKYRQYLALTPRPPNWEAVHAIAQQLEAELKPKAPAVLAATISQPAVTSAPPARPAPEPALATDSTRRGRTEQVSSHAPTSTPPAAVTASTPATSAPPSPTLLIAAATPAPKTQPSHPITSPPPALKPTRAQPQSAPAPAPPPRKPEPVAQPQPAPDTPPVEVTRVQEELQIKPPQDIVTAPAQETPATEASVNDQTLVTGPSPTAPQPKRGVLSRLNPFKARSKLGATNAQAKAASTTDEFMLAPPPAPSGGPIVVQRYRYLAPSKPAMGDRIQAEHLVREGVKAQQAGQLTEALAHYRAAVQADPSCFEARFNEGVAAYQLGHLRQALAAFEYALAIRPDSIDARYNFGLALKRANYPLDAAEQFQRLLQLQPDDVRAHYSLATLYAYQLGAPDRAKPHFQKVLELDPRHPEAGKIRFWLARTP
jgi:tetratricopeptide (TPR) repeat protein